jgi:chromatin remodeling complex protein RSC6
MAPKKQQEQASTSTKADKKATSTKAEKETKAPAASTKAASTKATKASTSTKAEKPAKVPKATKAVKVEDAESTEQVEQKPRRKATKETVNEDFSTFETKINEEIARLEERKKTEKGKVTGIQFLKQLRKFHKLLHRDTSRVLKIKKSNRSPNDQSGFKKPVKVTDEICKFFGWDTTKLYSRTDVTRAVCKYIRDNKLQDTTNKRIIRPDAKLTTLLKYDPKTMPIDEETKQPSPLYYYYLQKLLTRHFPESASKKQ